MSPSPPHNRMFITWNGTAATLVRTEANGPKRVVEPGETFDVSDEDYAKFLLNYHRKTMVEAPDPDDADVSAEDPGPVAKKDVGARTTTAITKRQRKTK